MYDQIDINVLEHDHKRTVQTRTKPLNIYEPYS